MFVKIPNLPEGDISCAIVDCNAPEYLFEYFKKLNIECIKTRRVPNVIDAVSTHPDMQICHLGNNLFVAEPTVYDYYCKNLEKYGAKVICGEKKSTVNYPGDISYNVVIAENFMIHNTEYTEKNILDYMVNTRISIYNVKQGYTKCATCIIDSAAVITSDMGIHRCCVENNIDSLLVSVGSIGLGMSRDGFFGGCCGMIGNKKMLFCGDVSKHPDFLSVKAFAEKYGVSILSASTESLVDIGSIIPVLLK